jgi:thioester reductase-like protein
MATFLTGATGFLGSYIAAGLLAAGDSLNLLVRAHPDAAKRRLWESLQFHFRFPEFQEHLSSRVVIFPGDLTAPRLGLSPDDYRRLVRTTDSVVHCAAALNRRSERACMDVNLRGTLAVVRFARAVEEGGELRRLSHVSTVSVAGTRLHETVAEDEAIDWARSDYDAYGRTKKFAETMVRELLDDVPVTVFRPSIVLGDSRRAETTQFDMVRAFSLLAGLPVLPLRPLDRIDIVPADWVGAAIVKLHRGAPAHDTYHLSAGRLSETYLRITDAIAIALGRSRPMYVPVLEKPFGAVVRALAHASGGQLQRGAQLLDAFFPYLVYDTVFDSERAVAELGLEPPPFTSYCAELLGFARRNRFHYPYEAWPDEPGTDRPAVKVAAEAAARTGAAE